MILGTAPKSHSIAEREELQLVQIAAATDTGWVRAQKKAGVGRQRVVSAIPIEALKWHWQAPTHLVQASGTSTKGPITLIQTVTARSDVPVTAHDRFCFLRVGVGSRHLPCELPKSGRVFKRLQIKPKP